MNAFLKAFHSSSPAGLDRAPRRSLSALGLSLFVLVGSFAPASAQQRFVRGDLDGADGVSLSDTVSLLGYLFRGAAAPGCADAADVNDDGTIDLPDATSILQYLFAGAAPPPPPHPACGADPTRDALGCEAETACAGPVGPVPARLGGPPLEGGLAVLLDEADTTPGPEVLETEEAPPAAALMSRESRVLPARRRGGGAGGSIIVAGQVVDGEILSRAQVDAYVFEAAPGMSVVLDRIAASDPASLNWTLEDAWGRVLSSNLGSLDDLGPVALLGGNYTIKVLPEGNGLGTYTFRWVDATPVEHQVAIGEIIPPGEIDLDHPGQRHHFLFSAPPGQTIFLDSLGTQSFNLHWKLAEDTEPPPLGENRLLVTSRFIADTGPISLAGGAYRLTVEGLISRGNLVTGGYEFRIAGVPSPQTQGIALGQVAAGEIAVPGKVDVWTFSAAAGQVVFLDQVSSTNSFGLDWELTDHLGRAILAQTTSLNDVGPISLAGGDYTLRILPEGSSVGSYSFRVVDVSSTLQSITIGPEVSGEIPADRPGRVNVHEFTAPPGRLITVELISTSSLGSLDWLLEDALGRVVLPRTTSLSTVGPIALVGGVYRLSVLGEGGATGTYRFRLRDDGPAPSAPAGAPKAVGDVIDEAIGTPGGEARYTFQTAAAQTVYLDLLLASPDIDWSLTDAVGAVLASARASSTDSSDFGPFPLAAGSYTVVLKARTATAAPAFKFQIASAAPVTSDASVGGTISGDFAGAPGGVHLYRLPVAEGARIFLDRLIVSTRLSWSLRDPAGQPVFALVRADGIDNDQGPFPLAAGTYTLVLDPDFGYQPPYEIAIRAVVDEEDTAAPGDVVSGSFAGRAGSTRTVLIDVPGGERLLFDRRSATPRIDWSLADAGGELVFGPVRFDSGTGDEGPFALPGGTYSLLLDPQAGFEPTYDIQIVEVNDLTAPLTFGQLVQGALGPGATATYTFTAVEGERIFLDLSTGASTLRWSLLDSLGEAVFRDLAASSATADVAPFNLAAGNYRLVLNATGSNTPSYAFTVSKLAVDLGIEDFSAAPRVVFAGDGNREVEVTWRVLNRGGGPAPTGAWVDRLTYSADTTLGNADDVLLGDFARFDTLEPWASYERREKVHIPAAAPLGQHRIFLGVDAGGAHAEPGGEVDNTASLEVDVVADLPPAEPDFISTTTFPFNFTASRPGDFVDIPLTRAVSLDSIRFVHAEAIKLGLTGPARVGGEVNLTMALLSGSEELLDVSTVTASGGGSFVARFARRLTPQVVALLPGRSVDGVRFRFDQPSTTESVITSIHQDGRLGVHFAGCEFAPCGPHLERRSPGLEGDNLVGSGVSEWRPVTFDEAVPGDNLRFVSGPQFTGGLVPFLGVSSASTEAQLILDNGTLVTLDDVRAPSTLGVPPFTTLSAHHSLGLTGSELAGRQILGFQWRIHLTGAGLGSPQAGFTPLDDGAIRFLYEVEACRGSIAIPPIEVTPADGTAFAPGSVVTLSGRALEPVAGRFVSSVLVNGEPVDSLDAAGRFFKTVRIAAGENLFVVQVVEPGCGESEMLLRFLGLTDGASGLEGFSEATAQLAVEYADTTFLRTEDALVVRARVRNVSTHSVRGPILMALTGLTPASASLRGTAGHTERGEPFTVLLESGTLAPGAAGSYVYLVFSNPERERVHYGVRWLVPADRPPHFESAPPVRAVVGQSYRYVPIASDPDLDAVVLTLERGPVGMTLGASGTLSWTPGPGDVGAHEVSLLAVAAGASATQGWTLTVTETEANRPPFFTTAPGTSAPVGSSYLYDSEATDPEGDALVYSLLEAPAGMAVGAGDGKVTWAFAVPGEHRVSLRAIDGSGGEAIQSYLLAVGTLPSNPSAPRITSAPAGEGREGILYVYQPVASDPDGDLLQFSLEESPAGMAVDARGRISWTPAADQVGTHRVSLLVRDGRGGETRQSFEIVVQGGEANLPPAIESVPGGFALSGKTFSYQVQALDPDGDAIHYALTSGPAGMSINETTGLLEWTPGAGAAGTHVVGVEAIDTEGKVGRQVFELRVRASNAVPRITSPPPAVELTAGKVYQHDVEAEDADGDLLRHELVAGPPAVTVHAITGLVTWSTTPADVGQHAVTVRVVDPFGGQAESSFTVTVTPDEELPAVAIGFSAAPAAVGATVEVTVLASDDVGIVLKTLTVECPPDAPRELGLDGDGRASFGSARPGFCTFRATATDPSGNIGTATQFLQVGNPDDPLDPNPPVVTVLTPVPGSVVTALTNVVATVTDATADGQPGSGPITWTVEIAPLGSETFERIGSGAGEVTNELLGTLDPTLRANGIYKLRIVGSDGVQTGGIEYEVSIAGELKLGNFTTQLVDLAIPVAGLPIAISRRYDSLDTEVGDFGAGWNLALAGGLTDSAIELQTGNGLVDLLGSEPLSIGDRVYVSRPDGRRVGFTFLPRPVGGFSFVFVPIFEPDPGVDDTLVAVEPPGNFFMIAGRANTLGVSYNPSVYKLTTSDGLSYTISEEEGLQRIENATGLAVDVRPDGLFSSSGAAVLFERDPEGKILHIVEPDPDPTDGKPPGRLDYEYDSRSNLVASSNQLGARVRYFYENPSYPHYLTRIENPLGQSVLRNAYDDEGRLIGVCGADGNITTLDGCTKFDADPLTRVSSITDNLGYRTDLVFDERGNLVLERSYFDDGSFLETVNGFDEEDNLVRVTDPSGEVWSFTYGAGGLQTSETDPLGKTWSSTYGDCNRLETETGPTGIVVRRDYNEFCELVSWTDPLGNEYQFEYDTNGFPAALVDPLGNRWIYRFDGSGYPLELRDASGRVTSFVVDKLGNLLSQTDAAGRTIEYERDAAHRVLREIWNSTPERVIAYEYDAAGRITRAVDPDSTTVFEYSAIGKVSRVASTGPSGVARTLTYEHDANGNTTRVVDSLGGSTSFSYDELRRLASIRQEGASVRPKRVDVSYSASSSLSELRRFSDLGATAPVASTSIEYSCETCEHGVTGVHHRRADGSSIQDIEIVRDDAGLVREVIDAEGRHVYAHDGAWRLLSVDHPAGGPQPDERYGYDAAGNRISSHLSSSLVYAYSLGAGGNELRGDDQFDYEVDAAGNIARRTEVASGRSTAYRYDHRNRLTEVTERNSGGTLLSSSTYFYDAADRRIRVVENGVVLDFVFDGSNPSIVLDGTGKVVARRLYARGSDTILADEFAGATRWYLTDHLGTVRDLVGDGGAPIAHYIYDSFGNLVAGSTPITSEGLGFIGRELSPATGLYHVRARPYDPRTGRFLQRDPLTPYQFEYTNNSPVMFVDSDGKASGVRRVSGIDAYKRRLAEKALREFDPPKPKSLLPKQPLRTRPSNRGRGGNEYALLVSNIALDLLTVGVLSSISGSIIAIFAGIPQRMMDALQDAIDDHIEETIRNGR